MADEHGVTVARLMTSGVRTVTADTAVTEAAATLLEEGIGSLVVVDEAGQPVGMLTNTDLAAIVAAETSRTDATVADHMTQRVVTIGVRSSLREAAAKMLINGIHHLPVTDDDGTIAGMLSTMDLTAHFSYTGGSETE